jgi:hypothetical protein
VAGASAATTTVRGTATKVAALRLTGGSAGRTTAGLAELSVCVKLLLAGTEDKLLVAVLAGQSLVRCVQKERSLLVRPQRHVCLAENR